MFGRAIRPCADDAALGQRDEYWLTIALGQFGGLAFHGIQLGIGPAIGHGRQLGGVHLEAQRRKVSQSSSAVGQHDQVGPLLDGSPCGHANRLRDDTRLGQIDLIHQDQGIDPLGQFRTWRASCCCKSTGVGVQFFESSRLSSRGGCPGSITSGLQ